MIQEHQYTAENCMDMLTARRVIRDRLFKPKKRVVEEPAQPTKTEPVKVSEPKRYDDHVERYYRYKWLMSKTSKTGRPTVRKIVETLCLGTGYTYDDILGHGKRRELSALRQFIHAEIVGIRRDLSFGAIGSHVNRDHSSIGHSMNVIHMQRHGVPREKSAQTHRLYRFDGEMLRFNEIARRCNVSSSMLHKRVISCGSVQAALKRPLRGKWIMCGEVKAWTLVGEESLCR